jgi:hypothetical protein
MAKNVLHEHFARLATHHVKLAKHHSGLATAAEQTREAHKAAKPKADLQGIDVEALSSFLENFIETHSAIADEHRDMAEHAADMAECAKAVGAVDLQKMATDPVLSQYVKKMVDEALGNSLVPTHVSAITPPRGVTPVVRAGQREIPLSQTVDPRFSKLVASGDEDHAETLIGVEPRE